MTAELSGHGALLGLAAGLAGWLVVSRVPWHREPTLDERLAPYLRGLRPGTGPNQPVGRTGTDLVEQILGPFALAALRAVERISGGAGTARRRLDQLGNRSSLEQFRAEQVICGLLGAAAGAGVAALSAIGRGFSVVPMIGLVVIGALLGVLGRDQLLSHQVRRRDRRMLAEFPAVAELLALAVGAGEGPVGALERVARTCRGELAAELRRTVADARTGMSLIDALTGLANRTSLPSLARFVDGIAVALDRGTPLAELLRDQARDVRTLTRRQLMESGGRREIAMLVPVVFLLLPVTVLFAIYPGLVFLDVNLT